MKNETKEKLREYLSLLKGIRDSIMDVKLAVYPLSVALDINKIATGVCTILIKDPTQFLISNEYQRPDIKSCNATATKSKLNQLINFLEGIDDIDSDEKVVLAGSLLKSIKDPELQSRCLDLLTAKDNFDRVINQATLVLEDRIRVKSETTERLEGVKLINKVLNTDLSKTTLKVSNNPDEQQGFCDICRGIMLSFRNPTHHHLTDKFTREDTLKQCAFIDLLLGMIDVSEKVR